MRILVAYVTRSGYTRLVAKAIANQLRAHGHSVDEADLEVTIRQPKDYDVVVVGSAIRFGKHSPVIATWIAEHQRDLALRPCAFFSVDHSAFASRGVDPRGHVEPLFHRLDWHPRHHAAFAGKLDDRGLAAFADEIAADASGLAQPPAPAPAARPRREDRPAS
jgi:menaquinone-dependent protoporphyrinogen oxidase